MASTFLNTPLCPAQVETYARPDDAVEIIRGTLKRHGVIKQLLPALR